MNTARQSPQPKGIPPSLPSPLEGGGLGWGDLMPNKI